MLETKDFIDIKMQDEARYKKPIGIYWAQVVSNYFLGDIPYDKIWVYRMPSLIGIMVSFLLIFNFLSSMYSGSGVIKCIFFSPVIFNNIRNSSGKDRWNAISFYNYK